MRNLFIKAAGVSCSLFLASFVSAQASSHSQGAPAGPQLKVRPQAKVSGTWQRLLHSPPASVGEPILLTDGTIMCHGPLTNKWYKLTPTSTGSYASGTWTTLASMQSDYGPLYFASSVLADGRVVVIGGEYNLNQGGVWTNKGSIYNPTTDVWSNLAAPGGWSNIGDAQCQVLPDGRFMLAHIFDTGLAILNPSDMTWSTLGGTGKLDRFDEEGWVLLGDGSILTCDAINAPHAEKYIPSMDKWVSAGDTPAGLADPGSQELGPMVLMPTGKVFAFGATGHNAIYTPGANPTDPGSWTAAPDFPNIGGQLDIADGPAVLLPNGNLMAYASPGVFNSPSHFYEWDGTALAEVANVPNSASNPSYVGNFLVLPNGQVMFTDFSNDVEIYTPVGGPNDAWRPTITSKPSVAFPGKSYKIIGKQFNGLSNGSSYGDDSTNNSNYPLVRIKYKKSGHVTYFRTYGHSTMGVSTGATTVSTNFAVPALAETGFATIEVVANGISSVPVDINITKEPILPTSIGMLEGTASSGSVGSILNSDNNYFSVTSAYYGASGQIASAFVTFTLPDPTASALQYSIETNTDFPVQALFFAWNYTTSKYDLIGASSQTSTDKVTNYSIASATKYVGPGGVTKVLIRAINPNRSNRQAPITTLKIDQITVSPS